MAFTASKPITSGLYSRWSRGIFSLLLWYRSVQSQECLPLCLALPGSWRDWGWEISLTKISALVSILGFNTKACLLSLSRENLWFFKSIIAMRDALRTLANHVLTSSAATDGSPWKFFLLPSWMTLLPVGDHLWKHSQGSSGYKATRTSAKSFFQTFRLGSSSDTDCLFSDFLWRLATDSN